MGQFNIFIASSSEQLAYAGRIADALSKLDHRPIRWWTSFEPSMYNVEALEATLQQADAGIFLCIGDDAGAVRAEKVQIPRDNVVLELGLYLGVLGRRRCFIVADQDHSLRLPTDLTGITRIRSTTDPDSVASLVVEAIGKALGSEQRQAQNGCIHVRADAEIAMKINGTPTPVEWHQRALYCGTEGAKAWLAYSNDEFNSVQTSADRDMDREQTIAALDGGSWRTFVSLGPGDSRRDQDVFVKLQTSSMPVQYVPVDISESLIHYAVKQLVSRGAAVPFGLLADFEEGQEFLFDNINRTLPQPCLFGLLGNTLGNLDIGAEQFLRQFATRIRRGDQLLIDIATTDRQWDFAPHEKYFASPIRRQFIAQGIARQLGKGTQEILDQFRERIAAKRVPARHAEQQIIYDTQTDKIGVTIRAYYFDKFRDWITKNLPFKREYANEYRSEGKAFGAGLIRLSKR